MAQGNNADSASGNRVPTTTSAAFPLPVSWSAPFWFVVVRFGLLSLASIEVVFQGETARAVGRADIKTSAPPPPKRFFIHNITPANNYLFCSKKEEKNNVRHLAALCI